MRIATVLATGLLVVSTPAVAQTSAGLIRYADVSDTQIAIVYGGDIWVAPKTGGTAEKPLPGSSLYSTG